MALGAREPLDVMEPTNPRQPFCLQVGPSLACIESAHRDRGVRLASDSVGETGSFAGVRTDAARLGVKRPLARFDADGDGRIERREVRPIPHRPFDWLDRMKDGVRVAEDFASE